MAGRRLPEFEAVPLGIERPAESPAFVLLDVVIDRDPGCSQVIEHPVEMVDPELITTACSFGPK